MNKFLAVLFLVIVTIALQVLVLMKGWGLEPKSWWWIIGVGVFANTFVRVISDKALKSEK